MSPVLGGGLYPTEDNFFVLPVWLTFTWLTGLTTAVLGHPMQRLAQSADSPAQNAAPAWLLQPLISCGLVIVDGGGW